VLQWNGRKLAYVFDGVVPDQAIVHVWNHAQIHAVGSGLLQHVLDDTALLTGRGEEYFVHKMLAGMLEKRFEGAYHVAGEIAEAGAAAGKRDKALEVVAKMPYTIQMIAERVRLSSGSNDEYVAAAYAAFKAMVKQEAVAEPAKAEPNGDKQDRDNHDAAGNIFRVNQEECAG